MIAHKLIDGLHTGSIIKALKGAINIDIIETIMSAQKFDIGEITELGVNLDTISDFTNLGLAKMPYEKCFFELYDRGEKICVLAIQLLNGILFQFFRLKNGVSQVYPYIYKFTQHGNQMIAMNNLTGKPIQTSKNEMICAGAYICSVLYFCIIISCSNTHINSISPSEKLNKKRKKNGKCQLFEYHILHISDKMNNTENKHGGSHSSPRVHLRRGHIRRLMSGSMIWVNACVVGNKKRGVVIKDYKYTNKERARMAH